MRAVFYSFCLLSLPAAAQVNFHWNADNTAEIKVSGETLKGSLKEGAIQQLTSNSVSVWLTAFSENYVAVAWAKKGRDQGSLIILEKQNAVYAPITTRIEGNAETLASDLRGAIRVLQETKKVDLTAAISAAVTYFKAHRSHEMSAFIEFVDSGKVKPPAKTATKTEPEREVKRPKREARQEHRHERRYWREPPPPPPCGRGFFTFCSGGPWW